MAGGCCVHFPGGLLVTVSYIGWGGGRWRGSGACQGACGCAGPAVRDVLLFPYRWCGVPAAPVRLYVVLNRVLPGLGGPGSRQRATEFGAKGPGGAALVPSELEAQRTSGLAPPPGEGLRAAGPPLRGGAPAHGSPHAAAGAVTWPGRAGMTPAAMRASQGCRRVTTAYSQRSRAAAHAARACPPASWLPSRRVRCAYLARSTGLWCRPCRPRARRPGAGRAGRGGRSGSCRPGWPRCSRRGSARRA